MEWRCDASTDTVGDDAPFVERLLTFGRRRAAFMELTFQSEVGEKLRCMLVDSAFATELCEQYIMKHIRESLGSLLNGFDLSIIGTTDAMTWEPLLDDGGLTINGMLVGPADKLKAMQVAVSGTEGFTFPIETRNFAMVKVCELLVLFVENFGLQSLQVPGINGDKEIDITSANMHFALRAKVAVVACMVKLVYDCCAPEGTLQSALQYKDSAWVFNVDVQSPIVCCEQEVCLLKDILRQFDAQSSREAAGLQSALPVIQAWGRPRPLAYPLVIESPKCSFFYGPGVGLAIKQGLRWHGFMQAVRVCLWPCSKNLCLNRTIVSSSYEQLSEFIFECCCFFRLFREGASSPQTSLPKLVFDTKFEDWPSQRGGHPDLRPRTSRPWHRTSFAWRLTRWQRWLSEWSMSKFAS